MRVLAPAEQILTALVHGDHFVTSGERTELEWLCKSLNKQVRDEDDHGGRGRRPGEGRQEY